jgi:hypothetical protein
MPEPSTLVRLETKTEDRPWCEQGEEALLVAALAATLVEYRRYVGKRNECINLNGAGANWRLVARMEQLRGKA